METKLCKSIHKYLTLVIALIAPLIIFATQGLNYASIPWGICVIIAVLIGSWTLFWTIFDSNWELLGVAMALLLIVTVAIIPAIISVGYYDEAIRLPHQHNSACRTIEETTELLLRYENNTGIAEGLEALELKHALKDAIERRNNLRAEIDAWLAHPLMPYKDVLKANLN